MSGVTIEQTGAYHFLDAITFQTNLLYLDISWNDIGPVAANLLGSVLKHNTSLRSLNMSGNPIGDEGAMRLALGLEASAGKGSLLALSLECCGVGVEGVKYVANMLTSNTR